MGSRKHAWRFLPAGDVAAAVISDPFELEESDVWAVDPIPTPTPTPTPTPKKMISSGRKRSAAAKRAGAVAGSLPVSVPDWCEKNPHREIAGGDDSEEEAAGERWIPPHEYLWRQRRRSGVASMSVHEGVGRTLKGRDLSRVRNAVWEKIGFQD